MCTLGGFGHRTMTILKPLLKVCFFIICVHCALTWVHVSVCNVHAGACASVCAMCTHVGACQHEQCVLNVGARQHVQCVLMWVHVSIAMCMQVPGEARRAQGIPRGWSCGRLCVTQQGS